MKKKLYQFTIYSLFILLLNITFAYAQENDVRNVKWGMTKAEVMQAENVKNVDNPVRTTILDTQCDITYDFENDKLIGVYFSFNTNPSFPDGHSVYRRDREKVRKLFNLITSELESKYTSLKKRGDLLYDTSRLYHSDRSRITIQYDNYIAKGLVSTIVDLNYIDINFARSTSGEEFSREGKRIKRLTDLDQF